MDYWVLGCTVNGMIANGHKVSFQGDENVLELGNGAILTSLMHQLSLGQGLSTGKTSHPPPPLRDN